MRADASPLRHTCYGEVSRAILLAEGRKLLPHPRTTRGCETKL